jgi:hypothetical protein
MIFTGLLIQERISETCGAAYIDDVRFLLTNNRIQTSMKNILLFGLAAAAVMLMLYAGLQGLLNDHSYGSFFMFVGATTTIGLGIDLVNHLKLRIRKSNIRKLGGF